MKTKENRKSRRFLVIGLLVLLFAITSAFVGSLARYSTQKTVSDSTVVAKFGLNVPNEINLFSDSYTNVQADTDGKKIIAPGTQGQYTFNITGTSEVAYKVSANISIEYSEEWNSYAPLKFSINGETWTDFAAFKENLNTAMESGTVAPNATYTSTQTIYWQWPISEDDAKDNEVGYGAASGDAASVSMNIEVNAIQVD
jgi:hypothetical protein